MLTGIKNTYTLGCGAGYGTALEGALKLGETVMVYATAYESEEYLHGPLLQLAPDYTVFLMDFGGPASERIRLIAEGTEKVTDNVFLLTVDSSVSGKRIIHLPEDLEEEMMPLVAIVFFQMISYLLTEELHRWKKIPALQELLKVVTSKTR